VSVASYDHEVRVEQPGLLRQHRENAVGQLNHPRLVGLRPSRNRRAHRLLVFDAGSRVLGVVDRGWRKRERVIAFADIRALAVEQREPRRIAVPVLTVNGEELLSVKDTCDNAHLEEEAQRLVGLPLLTSPRGPDSRWIDF
jgi:hypothetical protein